MNKRNVEIKKKNGNLRCNMFFFFFLVIGIVKVISLVRLWEIYVDIIGVIIVE